MPKSDLISRAELQLTLKRSPCKLIDGKQYVNLNTVLEKLRNAQGIDAVPVIHCKNCKHYRSGKCEQIEYIMDGYYRYTFEVKRPDDFCSRGERKEADHADD